MPGYCSGWQEKLFVQLLFQPKNLTNQHLILHLPPWCLPRNLLRKVQSLDAGKAGRQQFKRVHGEPALLREHLLLAHKGFFHPSSQGKVNNTLYESCAEEVVTILRNLLLYE